MLELKNIKKDYIAGENTVHALKGVSLAFRQSEFVAILGPSGCGKTTLLNIVGGLDRYSSGDLLIDGVSTKKYKDKDWDTYRNHEIGFVFQSYNLIPHLTVLENVELALTISGVSKKKRKEKATQALARVGLENQIHKRPNQLSGGQMQRVAIARAIVNDPNIILADEPTGALDTETSIQVMEILKEISKDRLVIMVTHNPELAEQYATRTIRLLDGEVKDDTAPFIVDKETVYEPKKKKDAKMSFLTSLTLSFKNLLTKKGRTFMISFAGSIGIIGIALVLSVSNGFTQYVNKMQNDMLSGYPVTISRFSADYDAMEEMTPDGSEVNQGKFPTDDKVHVYDPSSTTAKTIHLNLINEEYVNYIQTFYEEEKKKDDEDRYTNSIQFSYATSMNILSKHNDTYSFVNISPSSSSSSMSEMMAMFMGTSTNVFQEALDNDTFIQQEYDVIYGKYPQNKNEVAIIVDQRNRINVSTLQALGISYKDSEGNNLSTIDFADLVYQNEEKKGVEFKVIPNDTYYTRVNDSMGNPDYYIPAKYQEEVTSDLASYYNSISYQEEKDMSLKIVGVLRLNEDAPLSIFNSGILYLPSLTETFIQDAKASQIAELQNWKTTFLYGDYKSTYDALDSDTQALIQTMGGNAYKLPSMILKMAFSQYLQNEGTPDALLNDYILETARQNIGASDVPSSIIIYPKSFPAKAKINAYLDAWNEGETHKGQKIIYTDAASVFSSSIGQMIDIISYVLIAFTAISLVVSSIMIGIITYVSVIERTKEIGVLRSLGARKQDVSSVFNAETLLIGFIAGLLGIVVSYILCIPINLIIRHVAGPALNMNLAILNPLHALILLIVSMILTLISGFIPSLMAAKKDPVVALRTE